MKSISFPIESVSKLGCATALKLASISICPCFWVKSPTKTTLGLNVTMPDTNTSVCCIPMSLNTPGFDGFRSAFLKLHHKISYHSQEYQSKVCTQPLRWGC